MVPELCLLPAHKGLVLIYRHAPCSSFSYPLLRTLAGQTLPTDEYDASYRSAAHALSTGELRGESPFHALGCIEPCRVQQIPSRAIMVVRAVRSTLHAERIARERRVEDADLQRRAGHPSDHRGISRREPAARLPVDGEP